MTHPRDSLRRDRYDEWRSRYIGEVALQAVTELMASREWVLAWFGTEEFDSLDALFVLEELKQTLDVEIRRRVRDLYSEGFTWNEISYAINKSSQAAMQRAK